MTGYRILAIHAHPDDESSKGAATMAKYAAEGHRVLVATLTGGERGDILNPAMNRPGVFENICQVRREEMAKAAKALGIEHRFIGFVDSGLPQGNPLPPLPEGCFALMDDEKAAEPLVALVREFKPHVMITYDENGGYPHPDHIKCHTVSMIAWTRAGDLNYRPDLGEAWKPLKLYYTHGFIARRFMMFHEEHQRRGSASPYSDWLTRHAPGNPPDVMERVTTQVNCADYFDRRDEALRAHATQIDPNGIFFATDLAVQRRLWPTEEFELARSRIDTQTPENDLLAGLLPDPEYMI